MTAQLRNRSMSCTTAAVDAIQISSVARAAPPSPTKRGFDENRVEFKVPVTLSIFYSLSHPSLWTGPMMIVVSSMLINLFTAFWAPTTSISKALFVFAFFRISYNVGLGLLLHHQSNYHSVSRWVSRHLRRHESLSSPIIVWLVRGSMGHAPGFDHSRYPDCFNSWLAFRFLVDIILCNDAMAYIILAVKCWTFPERVGFSEAVQYGLGLLLAAFNYWAKVDAIRCVGDYSWYWGDNFFKLEQNLTFDGIFALVPHPMYTVGYAVYYGVALLSRSYTVLIASMMAHMLQILFLVIVENPHIDRTYGSNESPNDALDMVLYDAEEGLFPGKSDALFLLRLDLFRPTDLSLVLLIAYNALITYLLPSDRACIAHSIFWLFAHWIGIGAILGRQSLDGWWNQHFLSQGQSLHISFSHWKAMYNSSRTLYLAAFGMCALRLTWIPHSWSEITTGWVASVMGGIVLVLIATYSTISSYQTLGDFATFYGDFFIPADFYKPRTQYMGIYRFLNNPECFTGYAGLHGLALISQSWAVFWMALIAQALNFVFIKVIEVPHMEKIYAGTMREHTPAEGFLRNLVRDQISEDMAAEAERIESRAMQQVFAIYRQIATRQLSKNTTVTACLSCSDIVLSNSSLKCLWRTNGRHPPTDWIGIYKAGVESAPGMSKGRWIYVPDVESCCGELEFPVEKMPKPVGVYEFRYHTGQYDVIAKRIFIVTATQRSLAPDLPRKLSF